MSARAVGDSILIYPGLYCRTIGLTTQICEVRQQVSILAFLVYVAFEVEKIEINPQQLCQHLLVAGISNIELNELFQYELCSYPASLFDSKLDLQNDLVKEVPACVATDLPFVANPRNKQKCINLMSSQMEKEGINLKQSSGDADYDIAMSACALAQTRPVIIVGDDTDLLILLQYHC